MTEYTLRESPPTWAAPPPPTAEDSNPSILPWKTTREDLDWDWRVRGVSVIAWVAFYEPPPSSVESERPKDRPWTAVCFGPGDWNLDDWFATAEEARAAVKEHIAAHLKESAHEHVWVDVTAVESRVRQFLCADCGERKEESR